MRTLGAKTSQFKDFATFAQCAKILSASKINNDIRFIALGPSLPSEEIGGIRIEFIPMVVDRETVADYYRAADIYLHPARAENFPLAILEAMACGVPVVASSVGGIPEQVTDGKDGFLAEVGDAEAMSSAIIQLLSDQVLAQSFAQAAAARAKAQFGVKRMVDAYIETFERLLSARRCEALNA